MSLRVRNRAKKILDEMEPVIEALKNADKMPALGNSVIYDAKEISDIADDFDRCKSNGGKHAMNDFSSDLERGIKAICREEGDLHDYLSGKLGYWFEGWCRTVRY